MKVIFYNTFTIIEYILGSYLVCDFGVRIQLPKFFGDDVTEIMPQFFAICILVYAIHYYLVLYGKSRKIIRKISKIIVVIADVIFEGILLLLGMLDLAFSFMDFNLFFESQRIPFYVACILLTLRIVLWKKCWYEIRDT